MNNGMPNNMNGNGSYNNGGNSYAADRANAQMVSGQSSVGNGSGMMQGFSGVQNERSAMQGMANVQNNPGVMQGNNVPNQNAQLNQMPGQNHSGVNNYTMQKEEVKPVESGVVSVPGFDSPSQNPPSVPNFDNMPNQNIGSSSNRYNNLGNSSVNQNVNSTFNDMSNVNSNVVNNTPFSEINSNNIYGNSADVNSNAYGGANNTVSKPEVGVNEQKPLSGSLNNDSSLNNSISSSGNGNAFDRLNSAINDNYGSVASSKPISNQVGNGIGSSVSSVNSMGTSNSYGTSGVNFSTVNGTHDSDKKPDGISIPKPAGIESLNNTGGGLNNNLNSNYNNISNNVNSTVNTGIGSMNNSGINSVNNESGSNINSNNMSGVKPKRPEPMFRDNNQNMIGSTRDLNNAINGIKPTSMSDGVSQVGQMEMNNKSQFNTSYQPPKKKFPLSVREMILVSIALIGVVVVVIMYWPK